MTKTVFIDFDGTFADRGLVPPGHFEAVHRARENGHRVFLCTGRPKISVPAEALGSLFDGVVCTAGGYVEIKERVLSDVRFPPELAARTLAELLAHDAAFLLEAPQALFSTDSGLERIRKLYGRALWAADPEMGLEGFLANIHTPDDLSTCSFSKVVVVDSPVPVTELAEAIGPEVGALPDSVTGRSGSGGELYQLGVDKSAGIAVVEAHLGLRRRDIIAIGDGTNDIEMLAYAGLGIAVEGSPPEVLAVAQRTIPGPAVEGVAQAFAELGLTR
ncbi:MAG: Cof-type HAD-IIB family hydrolase [Actinobacteria bacterium]|nr:Cof-type HAD-IIB family hydrolase [Actinomycetota bacterium]